MFLVIDRDAGMYVFCEEDPRDGEPAPEAEVEQVELRFVGQPGAWSPGTMSAEMHLGRKPGEAGKFQVFNSARDCDLAEYDPVTKHFQTVKTWAQYVVQREEAKKQRPGERDMP